AGAGARRRARPRAGAGARRARRLARQVDGGRDAAGGVLERQVQLGLEVAPPVGAGAPAGPRARAGAAEQATEDVAEVAQVLEPEAAGPCAGAPAGETCAHGPEAADLVVLLALLGVADHVVGGRDLLEALLGGLVARVGVGVVLARELPVGVLDLLLGGGLADPEDSVVILLEPLTLGGHELGLRLS